MHFVCLPIACDFAMPTDSYDLFCNYGLWFRKKGCSECCFLVHRPAVRDMWVYLKVRIMLKMSYLAA